MGSTADQARQHTQAYRPSRPNGDQTPRDTAARGTPSPDTSDIAFKPARLLRMPAFDSAVSSALQKMRERTPI